MSVNTAHSERIVIFEAVMRTGSLSAAARDLELSQPTVRRAIEALEAEVSASLFTRSVNELVPTAKGRDLSQAARAVVEASYAFHRSATADKDLVSGTVRISASQVISHFTLPKMVADLRDNHPELKVELAPDDRRSDLLRRDADIAIRHVAPSQKQLVAQKVPSIELGLFTKGKFRAGRIDDVLKTAPFIWEDRGMTLTKAARELDLPEPAHVAAATDDQALQIALIAAGVGIGVAQVPVAKRLGLEPVDPGWRVELPVWIVAHEDQINSSPIRQTFDLLVAGFRA